MESLHGHTKSTVTVQVFQYDKDIFLHSNRKMEVYFVCMLFKTSWEKDNIYSWTSKARLPKKAELVFDRLEWMSAYM